MYSIIQRAAFSMRSCRYYLFAGHSHSTVRGPYAPINLEKAFPGSQRLEGGVLSGQLCLLRNRR